MRASKREAVPSCPERDLAKLTMQTPPFQQDLKTARAQALISWSQLERRRTARARRLCEPLGKTKRPPEINFNDLRRNWLRR